jgi:hypothetical protein
MHISDGSEKGDKVIPGNSHYEAIPEGVYAQRPTNAKDLTCDDEE